MPNQSERTRHRDVQCAAHECIENPLKVLELGGEGVVPDAVWQRELTGIVNAAPAEIEGDGGKSGSGQALGQMGEHSPVLEALETVNHNYRRSGGFPTRRSNVNEDLTQHSGQRMLGKRRCSHR
jgi:hypothetical protein